MNKVSFDCWCWSKAMKEGTDDKSDVTVRHSQPWLLFNNQHSVQAEFQNADRTAVLCCRSCRVRLLPAEEMLFLVICSDIHSESFMSTQALKMLRQPLTFWPSVPEITLPFSPSGFRNVCSWLQRKAFFLLKASWLQRRLQSVNSLWLAPVSLLNWECGTIVPISATNIPLLSLVFSHSSVFIQTVTVSRLAALSPRCRVIECGIKVLISIELSTLIPGWGLYFPPSKPEAISQHPHSGTDQKANTHTHVQCVCCLTELRDTFLLPSLCCCVWISDPWYFSVGLRVIAKIVIYQTLSL